MNWETDNRVAFFFAGAVITFFLIFVSIGYKEALPVLKDWQTLAAGLIATVAAIITVSFLSSQIRQAERFEMEHRKSKNLAARAAVHQPLSTIMADQSVKIRILADSLEVSSSPNINIDRRTLFEANPDSISALVNCLEFSDDPSVRSDLSELISLLQIQDARLQTRQRRNMRGRVTSDNRTNAEHYLVDALEIYARSGRLLLYARLEDQEYKERELRDLMKSAAFLNNVEELNDSFEQIFGRRLQTLV